jgi:hypothetical protein
LRDPFLDLSERLSQLLLARLVRRIVELSPHLDASQLQRLDLADTLGIEPFAGLSSLPFFFFPFFHSLGEAGFRVNESFSGVTHGWS